MKDNNFLKMTAILGGADVRTPRNIKDLKMAELEVSDKVKARYSTIKEAMDDLSEDEIKTIVQMIFLDFVNPSIGFDILDYFKEISLLSCDYLLKHKDERMPFDEAFNKLENLDI